MIKENQRLLNQLNVLSDAVLFYVMLPLSYWIRFRLLPGGVVSVPLSSYLRIGIILTLVQLFTYAAFGLYQTTRRTRIRVEVSRLILASLLVMALLLGTLFITRDINYSRGSLAIFYFLVIGTLGTKRIVVRKTLRKIRADGRNLKHVLIIGNRKIAKDYLSVLQNDRELGYQAAGYIAKKPGAGFSIPYLGGYEALEHVLDRLELDEVISAIEMTDFELTPLIIEQCEKAGVKLSIIPFYTEYMPAHPQFDDVDGIPLLNIRRIPLDNFANAMAKRAMDIVGSLLMIIVLSPVLLICAIGVKFSSPGPILFRQQRIGKNRKPFTMYKFRSLVVNNEETTAWTQRTDDRRTRFGAFIRKYSLDELPQLFCVLTGTMSLVGPRPEIPHFVDRFKNEIPLYMVRHQVRPGITGWAQIKGFRGDTPIKARVEHDLWYIENWTIWLDIQILLQTLFGGFINREETLKKKEAKKEQETKKEEVTV